MADDVTYNAAFYRHIPSRREMIAATLARARAAGCTCNPDIRIPDPKPGKVSRATVAHDDWCPLIRGSS